MAAFSLQQVNYPTGGKTVFNYEPNDYDFQKSQTGPQDFQFIKLVAEDSIVNVVNHDTTKGTINLNYIQPILPVGSQQANLTINVTFRFQGDTSFNYKNTLNKLSFGFNGQGTVNLSTDIYYATCSGPVCNVSIPVTVAPIGTYNWWAYIDPSVDTITQLSEIHLDFHYSETQQDYDLANFNSLISPASGLRIHSVLNYSDASTVASEKVYNYGYSADLLGTGTPQSYSYGRLMSFPSYVRYSIVPSGGVHCDQLSLFSSSYTALSSVIQGNIVGYDQVTETSVDPATGNDIGRTVYKYFNSPDSSVTYGGFRFPGCYGLGNSLTGTLLSKVTYANNSGVYNKIEETDNYYHTANRNVYFSPKYSFPQTTTPIGSYCSAGTAVHYEVMACFYPSIKSEKTLLDSTAEISYQQLDTTKAVSKTTAFYYDNPIHYQVTRTRTIDSKGNKLVDRASYPQDYIPNGNTVTGNTILDSMIGRNMVSETIEKADSLYYPGASSGSVTGGQVSLYRVLAVQGNTIGADKIYKLDLQAPITNFQPFAISANTTSMDSRYEKKVSFDHYDPYSNITQYTPEDGVTVSFLWDYTGNYPIAKVTGSDTADIAYTSFEADGNGHWTIGSATRATGGITGGSFYTLNSDLSKTGLNSSASYVVSYWSNGGSYSVPGTASGYPVKGKVAIVSGTTWTYYEHLVTGQTTVQINGSGGIDELRLYPSGAQMTTFTYTPMLGVTSQCDVASRITYYEYDAFQRLADIKDQDQNILKRYCYNYNGQSESCALSYYPASVIVTNNAAVATYVTLTNTATLQVYTFTAAAGISAATVGQVTPGTYNITMWLSSPNSSYFISYTLAGNTQTNSTPVTASNITIGAGISILMNHVASVSVNSTDNTNQNITVSFAGTLGTYNFSAAPGNSGLSGYIPVGTYNVTITPANTYMAYPINYTVNSTTLTNYLGQSFPGINGNSAVTLSAVAPPSVPVEFQNTTNLSITSVFTNSYGGTINFTAAPGASSTIGYVPQVVYNISMSPPTPISNKYPIVFTANGNTQTLPGPANYNSISLPGSANLIAAPVPTVNVNSSDGSNKNITEVFTNTWGGQFSFGAAPGNNGLSGTIPQGAYNLTITPTSPIITYPILWSFNGTNKYYYNAVTYANLTITGAVSVSANVPPNISVVASNSGSKGITIWLVDANSGYTYGNYTSASGTSNINLATIPSGQYQIFVSPGSGNTTTFVYSVNGGTPLTGTGQEEFAGTYTGTINISIAP